ncbi:glycosyltransferase family 2 protein [Flavobacterium maritimum]|uniref:glycosyltransferase family 2 protein n=1 Tax=Flavobacterium maritimum TaxID=3149042 RepID=UPI0032B628A3
MENFRFSVWTATFNRATFLVRLYESLKKQTFKDFEWIIVDDGSTDNTKEIVDGFIAENSIKSIRYLKKNHGGKHTAWRAVINEFQSKYVVTIDSDDQLSENALEIFDRHWTELEKSEEYESFWEIKGRVQGSGGLMIGKPLPTKVFDSTYDELTYKHKYTWEMHACRKTTVLQNEGKVPENFLFDSLCSNFSESIRWSRAGQKYKSRFIDEIVRTYFFDAGDTLSKSNNKTRSIKNTYNNLVDAKYTIEERKKWMLKWDKKAYVFSLATLLYTSFCLSKNPFSILDKASVSENLLLGVLYIPILTIYKIRK